MLCSDLHSHLLWGIDDGARNGKETAEHLKVLSQNGVTRLALTPHFYPSYQDLDSFLSAREQAASAFLTLPEAKAFSLSLGAEVYLTEALFNYEDLSPLCYGKTPYLLTELETKERFTPSMERRLVRLTDEHGIRPVLAHIERYGFLLSDERLLFHLKQMGCLFQMNPLSFSSFFAKKKLLDLGEKGYLDFFGQDLHRAFPAEKACRSAMSFLEKKGTALIARAEENASLIFSGANETVF